MASTSMSSAAAAAMAAYEAKDRVKAESGRRSPIYSRVGLGVLLLSVLIYSAYYFWSSRTPALNSPPAVLAAFMATPQYADLSSAKKVQYRDAWGKIPQDQRQALVEKMPDDARALFFENQANSGDPNDPREKERQSRMAAMQKSYLDAHSAEEKRALMAEMEKQREQWRQQRATSQPTSQPNGGGWGGGGGPGGGFGRGGPGGQGGPPEQRMIMQEMRINGREARISAGGR